MSPTDELIASIVDQLTKLSLVTARAATELREKMTTGSMSAQGWRDLVATPATTRDAAK